MEDQTYIICTTYKSFGHLVSEEKNLKASAN